MMTLFFIAFALAQEYVDDTPDCLDTTNTTVPQTTCTISRCECHLCFRNGDFSTSFCVFATNATMVVGNTTWACPSVTNATLAACYDAKSRSNVILGVLLCVALAIVLCIAGKALYDKYRHRDYSSF